MGLRNTDHRYGEITKTFHWITALLILTAIPLGLIANRMGISPETLALKAQLFSLHKTVGIAAFFVGVARVLWAMSQQKPASLNAERPMESFLAETVHWLLYASLIIVPLSGWLHHAATSGFAPILWPFGQGLPLVAKSETLAQFFSAWHYVFTKVLAVTVILHIAGALKHHIVDRDATLRRMWFGQTELDVLPAHQSGWKPFLVAVAIYAGAITIGSLQGLSHLDDHQETEAQTEISPNSDDGNVFDPEAPIWTVEDGTLSITVTQLGAPVTGIFETWSADISFDEITAEPVKGHVGVEIDITSLTLGSVTANALGGDFFDSANFPSAVFEGPISGEGNSYVVDGALTLKSVKADLSLPFTLHIDDGIATMSGTTKLDRRTFKIGETYPDESTVSFAVKVDVTLKARLAN